MPPYTPEQLALFSLHLVSGLGPRLISHLLDTFGSAQEACRASPRDLAQVPHLSQKIATDFHRILQEVDIPAELQRMEEKGVHLAFLNCPGYPENLTNTSVPPRLLYIRGQLLPPDHRAIALVGSRHCSAYGKRVAERLALDLARQGWTVISGLARGIDGAAHLGAIKGGGRTLAVLANGLSRVYPPEHAELADQVANSGALLTEYHMNMEPLPVLFPARNRIISGLAQAIVVIEANAKSGALITAHHATEQGREVFAIPGPVDSLTSAGTLELLRKGARMARNAEDILEDLKGIQVPDRLVVNKPEIAEENDEPEPPPPGLDEQQRQIWGLLTGQVRHTDEIVQALGIEVSRLSGILMMMEMKKTIRRLPGNRWELTPK